MNRNDPISIFFARPAYCYIIMFMVVEQIQTWPLFSALTPQDQVTFLDLLFFQFKLLKRGQCILF